MRLIQCRLISNSHAFNFRNNPSQTHVYICIYIYIYRSENRSPKILPKVGRRIRQRRRDCGGKEAGSPSAASWVEWEKNHWVLSFLERFPIPNGIAFPHFLWAEKGFGSAHSLSFTVYLFIFFYFFYYFIINIKII